MTQVSACEVLEARRALTPATAIACAISSVMTSFGMIGKARCSCRRSSILEVPTRRAPFKCRAGKHARLMNVTTKPIGIENLVETLPVRVRCAQQRAECRFQCGWPRRQGSRKDREGVSGFGEPDLETVVAQRAREAGQPAARRKPPVRLWTSA